jgi:hypothetical protein
MKKSLIILLLLAISSVHAREYQRERIQCGVSADYTDLNLIENVRLDHQLIIYDVIYIAGTNDIVRVSSNKELLPLPNIQRGGRNILGVDLYYKIDFKKLDAKKSKQVLEMLGATNVPNLKEGFGEFGTFEFVQWGSCASPVLPEIGIYDYGCVSSDFLSRRLQSHFPIDEHDGLSYHLNITCAVL